MKVTQVKIHHQQENGKVRALATVTLDEQFAVHGLRVIEGQHGLFVSMPGRKTQEGKYLDIAHPVTSELRSNIQDTVLQAYFAEL